MKTSPVHTADGSGQAEPEKTASPPQNTIEVPVCAINTRVWTPANIERMIVCATACVSWLIYVVGCLLLIDAKVVAPTALGAISGTGLLGLGALNLRFLKVIFGSGGRIAGE